jgi:thiol-disulfide isomerase/thioredoxin
MQGNPGCPRSWSTQLAWRPRLHPASAFLVLVLVVSGQLLLGAAGAGESPRFDGRLSQFIYLKPLEVVRPTRFRDAGGRIMDFRQFRGKVVLVNFWATWCPPCVAEMPTLDRLQVRLAGDRFTVVAIALNTEGLPPVAAFFQRQSLTHLQIYLDPEHRTIRSDAAGGTGAPFPLYGLPISYLLDEQGRAIGYLKSPADWGSSQAIDFLEYFIARTKK